MKKTEESSAKRMLSSQKSSSKSKKILLSHSDSTPKAENPFGKLDFTSVLFFRVAVLVLLGAIFMLGIEILSQVKMLETQRVLEHGGEANFARAQKLYQSEAFAKYFENEIAILEKRVNQQEN